MIDAIDRRILNALQRDATLSTTELADVVGLSSTPCWRRVRRLHDEGYVSSKVTLLDRDRLDLGVTVFVAVKTSRHDEDWLGRFATAVSALPEVVEFYRMSGEVDYLLKIVCRDIADYDRIYKKLIRAAPLHDVSSSFAMEQIKFTTELPL